MKPKIFEIEIGEKVFDVELLSREAESLTFVVNGSQFTARINPKKNLVAVNSSATAPVPSVPESSFTHTIVSRKTGSSASTTNMAANLSISSPLPGIVAKLLVRQGDEISPGQPVAIIEAMKMENVVTATVTAVVSAVLVREGDEVRKGAELISYSF